MKHNPHKNAKQPTQMYFSNDEFTTIQAALGQMIHDFRESPEKDEKFDPKQLETMRKMTDQARKASEKIERVTGIKKIRVSS